MSDNKDNRAYLEIFIEESNENLRNIENDLIAIEQAGADIDDKLVNRVFRAAHTIKGSAGFFELSKIKDLAHRTESVLDLIRSRKLVPTPDVVNILLHSFDRLREMINSHETSGDADITELIASLSMIVATVVPDKPVENVRDSDATAAAPAKEPYPEPAVKSQDVLQACMTSAMKQDNLAPDIDSPNPVADTTLRVSVDMLENLMNLAGELVLGRNQLLEAIHSGDSKSIGISGQKIDTVTSELQEAIMLTRMQPVGNIFNHFPRVVRDLARKMSKNVKLVITGKDVELDKTIIEGLADPLTHMVRNAVDHGIEEAQERILKGKDSSGTISLKAYHEAGQVIIEVSDDGRGVDSAALLRKAVSMGLIDNDMARLMSEKEILNLMFLPGLSTSQSVTDLSGRGVGMDVVKNAIDKLGGKTDIISQPGKGSVFRIKLPLTLAIIPCLLVSVQDEWFALPQTNVDELIRIRASEVKNRLEVIGTSEALNLRGKIIPVIRLADILGIDRKYQDQKSDEIKPDRRDNIADRRSKKFPLFEAREMTAPSIEEDKRRIGIRDRRENPASDLNIVVISAGALQYGLVVDELHDTVEIVVKPLGKYLKHLREYAGTTIMGDGTIAIILDASGIISAAGLTSFAGSTRQQELDEMSNREKIRESMQYLIFFNSTAEQCAVPLDMVARIERVSTGMIETSGGRKTMKYRDSTLPLFTLADAADTGGLPDRSDYIVIVFDLYERQAGLIAAPPVDILEVSAPVDRTTLKQKGIRGSAIIRSATTLIVDMQEIVSSVHPEWTSVLKPDGQADKTDVTILLVEDSDFFRAQITNILESAGYKVIGAVDGQAAWELFQSRGEEFTLGVFDIEMPRMNGIELAEKVRSDRRYARFPIIALSALADDDDIERAMNAGVTEYQIKLDRDKLLESVANHVKNMK